ncbi:MAG: alanine racemase [Chloroflexota bacterium]
MSPDAPGRAPIEDRLAAAGLPPLPRSAWLEIDLDAITANFGIARELAGAGVRVEPVVKADAYGHGMVPVARALAAAGADGLCVATLDEALALREAGVAGRLTVLYPVPPALARAAAQAAIAVAAGDPSLLAALLARADQDAPPLEIELEIETGLGRGGVAVDAAADAARAIAAAPGCRLAGVWTHMQAVEDAPRTAAQVRRFDAALAAIEAAGVSVSRRHVAASTSLLTGEVPVYDAVRPGLMTYGLIPDELEGSALVAAAGRLRPVMSLVARPVRVVQLQPGHGISYGPTFETGRPSRIATLPLGYGDGWSRSLSNRAEALVRGIRVPLVGNVAMDAVMADVTDVPGAPVDVDDEFVLLGRQGAESITASDLARARTTNSWEIVTSMSRRLTRVYDAGAGVVDLRTLTSLENRWLGSNSGTGTSATSRSTRS